MRNKPMQFIVLICLFLPLAVHAQLHVKVNEPKKSGDKVIIKLEMKNTFTEKVESARTTVFLFDEQGKIAGQATRWVIGGTKDRPALAPGKETTFNLVITVILRVRTSHEVAGQNQPPRGA